MSRCTLKHSFVITSLTFIFLNTAAYADTIYAKNGDVISGKLISFHDGLCIFSTKYGSSISLHSKDIASLVTDDKYSVVFNNGDTASGQLVRSDAGNTVLESTNFGRVEIKVDAITSLTKQFVKEKNSAPVQLADSQKSYGENTEKQPPLDFLTGSTVLLAPGKIEIDVDARYKQTRNSHELTSVGYFQKSSYTARQLELSTSIRAGLTNDIEGWLSVPFTYSHVHQASTNEYVRSKGKWGLSDIAFGLQYQWLRETLNIPAISFTFDITAPTGEKRYYVPEENWKDPLSNGNGHWSVGSGVSFVRTTDPAILFGGVSYRHFFQKTIDGYRIKPGDGLAGYFGVGFALNDRLSVGTRFSYSYYRNMTVNGETIHGSDTDPMDISLSSSYRFSDNWVMTPQVTFSLNTEAGAPFLSLRLNRRFN